MNPAKQEQEIVVQIAKNFKDIDVNPSKLKKLVKAVCSRFAGYPTPETGYEISIAIVDDAEISRLNKQFLNRNCSTDCLSFDLSDDVPGSPKTIELVVNAEKALREAKLRSHSGEAELALYITHALLHNFGFDDYKTEKANKMHHTEDKILQQMGYGSVYNNSTGT
jgi:probable rRNA maturation factor